MAPIFSKVPFYPQTRISTGEILHHSHKRTPCESRPVCIAMSEKGNSNAPYPNAPYLDEHDKETDSSKTIDRDENVTSLEDKMDEVKLKGRLL